VAKEAMTDVVHIGDAREELARMADSSVDCCVTSPPYFGLRDYGHAGQIGQESSPAEYVARLRGVFAEVRRVLKSTGSLWITIGDSFVEKNLLLVPARLALALQDDGWTLRSSVIWRKCNILPQGAASRFTLDYEHVFQFTKSPDGYFFDGDAVREPWTSSRPSDARRIANGHAGYAAKHATGKAAAGLRGQPVGDPSKGRNRRSVWDISAPRFKGAHFATMPTELARLCIVAGCPAGGIVLDPFAGSGTVLQVARELGRGFVGVELNPDYEKLIKQRLNEGA
jgi:site-specific DNA-methyltransferase (adenine-specific)